MGGGGCCVGNCCIANCGFCCIGDFFGCSSDGSCCVGNCADSGGPGSDTHAQKISNELASIRERAANFAREQEEQITKDIDDSMTEFLEWIESINSKKIGGRALSINVERLKRLNRDMHDDVEGFIGRQLNERLVSTDNEVTNILAEPDDKKRKKNFDDFYERIKREAVRELIKKIEESVERQSDSVEREIKNRMDEVQSSMQGELKALRELQTAQQSEASALKEKQLEYMYYLDLCDTMDEELKRAEAN